MEKDHKFTLGIALLIWSFAACGVLFLIPKLEISGLWASVIAIAVILSAEVSFLASIALLGRPFFQLIKTQCSKILTLPEPGEPKYMSRQRHRFGIFLFLFSTFPFYAALTLLLLGDPDRRIVSAAIALLITGELLFLLSLWVLGPEFREKLRNLFVWSEGPPSPLKKPSE